MIRHDFLCFYGFIYFELEPKDNTCSDYFRYNKITYYNKSARVNFTTVKKHIYSKDHNMDGVIGRGIPRSLLILQLLL